MDWRTRLQDAIYRSGKSMRSVAIQAGLNPGYVYEIIKYGRDPSLSSLLKICDVLEIDLIWLCYGLPALPETKELLMSIQRLSPEQRRALLVLLKQ
jgi:transcriptional regulator with XRE-family HTH domain